jgi:hypothetical protein
VCESHGVPECDICVGGLLVLKKKAGNVAPAVLQERMPPQLVLSMHIAELCKDSESSQ